MLTASFMRPNDSNWVAAGSALLAVTKINNKPTMRNDFK
jgi:hypothetical protein